jgi:hypothetical protein
LESKTKKPSIKSSKTQNDELVIPDHGTRSSHADKVLAWIDETFEVIIYPSGFEDCIVGVGERFGGPPVAVLDVEKMFKKMESEGMTREEAIEYFEFNILGAHVGEENPVYLHIPEFKIETKTTGRKGAQTE